MGDSPDYNDSPKIQHLLESVQDVDYIIAPIADNRIFEVMGSFANGEITDIQCMHCLSATNLGKQYVLKTPKAIEQIEANIELFLCTEERRHLDALQDESFRLSESKLHYAKREFRGQGKYIEEILNVR